MIHRTNSATARGEHALWVGNIPTNTTIMRLRDYFSQAMPTQEDLLSISYNPEARYAFVNFRTESARMTAIQQAACQLFDEKRLDCRIRQTGQRRSTKVNYGLEAGRPGQPISIDTSRPENLQNKVDELSRFPEADASQHRSDKFFILKSYSMETLYQSLATGTWNVPRRHVERLNHAFQTASNVYLIFSVNGSGQFFGYAVMRAEIRYDESTTHPHQMRSPGGSLNATGDSGLSDNDTESEPDQTSRRHSCGSCDTVVSTGSISYVPERRKITWLAPWAQPPPTDQSPSSPLSATPLDPFASSHSDALMTNLANFSHPCQIKWLSTQSLLFDEIRGLRNAWNSDKEVHIARNVTPVEPTVAMAMLERWLSKEWLARAKNTSPRRPQHNS
jgi:hypothetical protein